MPSSEMTGAEALARMLDGYGVTHFFMVPAVIRQTMVEVERLTGIARVHAHGEEGPRHTWPTVMRACPANPACVAPR